MIPAKIAKVPKILIVFDKPGSIEWVKQQKVTPDGIGAFLTKLTAEGIDIVNEVSAICLADSLNPKATDYKEKEDYVKEVMETYAFNVVMPVGAAAFTQIMGFKGIEKYLEKTIFCEKYNCKVLPAPLPSMIKFKPEIIGILANTAKLAKTEMEFPEIVAEPKILTHYYIIDTISKFDKFMEVFYAAPAFAFDTETTGFSHNVDEILCAQFTHKVGFSYLIPTQFYNQPALDKIYWNDGEWEYIKHCMVRLFSRKDVIIIGHNLKFDLRFINYWWGVPIPKPANMNCTLAMAFLIDENTPNDLKHLACVHTDLGDYERDLDEWKRDYVKKMKIKMGDFSYKYIPFDLLSVYAMRDTDATFRLWLQFKEDLKREGQEQVFEMLMKFTYAACHMEINGWPVDVPYAKTYLEELNQKIEEQGRLLYIYPDVTTAKNILAVEELNKVNAKRKNKLSKLPTEFEFNLSSNNHKRVLFFTVMGLPVVKYTKARDANGKRTTPSTDKEVLEKWGFDYPKAADFLDQLKTYGELCKMKSTYVESIINKSVNGRIYPTYNTCGCKPGRWSSKNP